MQIKISFAAAYDFNQYVPRPADFDPFPAPPRTVGKGGFPAPPRPIDFLPSPYPPCPAREKNSFPVHPWKIPVWRIISCGIRFLIIRTCV